MLSSITQHARGSHGVPPNATTTCPHSSSVLSLSSKHPRAVLAPGSTLQIPKVGSDCVLLLLLVFNPRLQMLDVPVEVCDDAGVLVNGVGDILQVTFDLVNKNKRAFVPRSVICKTAANKAMLSVGGAPSPVTGENFPS